MVRGCLGTAEAGVIEATLVEIWESEVVETMITRTRLTGSNAYRSRLSLPRLKGKGMVSGEFMFNALLQKEGPLGGFPRGPHTLLHHTGDKEMRFMRLTGIFLSPEFAD